MLLGMRGVGVVGANRRGRAGAKMVVIQEGRKVELADVGAECYLSEEQGEIHTRGEASLP